MQNSFLVLDKCLSNKLLLYFFIIAAILLKFFFLPLYPENGDYETYLLPWMHFIKTHGFWSALKYEFSTTFPPLYTYAFIVIAKLNLPILASIKILSIIFEYVCALFIAKIIQLKNPKPIILLQSLALFPLLPTIIINSSYWAQCDSIYTAFILGSVYYLLRNNNLVSMLFLGLAFSLKLQSIFILPFFFIFLLKRKISWYQFLIVPIIYFITFIPTLLEGRSIVSLMNIYKAQSEYFNFLTLNFPNLYAFASNSYFELFKYIGIILCFLAVLFGCIYLAKKNKTITFDFSIRFLLISTAIVPFLLPCMHERYLYLGEAAAMLFFLYFKKDILYPVGIWLVSLYAYSQCTRLHEIIPLWPASILFTLLIGAYIYRFFIPKRIDSE